MSIFQNATRQKIRFETSKGLLSTEDLWDLPLTSEKGISLDSVAREIFVKLKGAETISFVKPASNVSDALQLRFDVVKYIIDVKMQERDVAAVLRANSEKKRKLLEILESKESEALSSLSMEELRAQINSM